jgi:hypothetical protein
MENLTSNVRQSIGQKNAEIFCVEQGHRFDDDTRDKLWGGHPVVTGAFILPTPPILTIAGEIIDAVENQARGAAYFGCSGMGKSSLFDYVKLELAVQFSGIPVVGWGATVPSVRNERAFHKLILESCDAQLRTTNTALSYARQVSNLLWARASDANSRQIILMIDEAQNHLAPEWRWLKTIVNLLKTAQINATVISVGDIELHSRRELFFGSTDYDLVNRFMPTIKPFPGLRSEDELEKVLGFYDNNDFPKGSGVSFAQFFLGNDGSNGWTLASEAASMWKAALEVTGEQHLGLGMEGTALAVKEYLLGLKEPKPESARGAGDVARVARWKENLTKRHLPVERAVTPLKPVKKEGK